MTRIGIYTGKFSPPHNGHVAAARAFMEQMWLDYLYVVPMPIFSQEKGCLVGDVHRLQMCRLAFSETEGVYVSDMAMGGEDTQTVDILRALSGEDRRLFLLCGTDEMLTLDDLCEPSEVFRISYPTYARREADPSLDARIVEKISGYHQSYGKVVRRIVTDPMEISSDMVRRRLQKGVSVSSMIPSSVEKYILDNHLYV